MFDGAEGIRGQGKEVCVRKVPFVHRAEGVGMARPGKETTGPFPEQPSCFSISLVVQPSLRSCVLAGSLFVCFFPHGCNERFSRKSKSIKAKA